MERVDGGMQRASGAQLVYGAPRRAALSLASHHRAGFLYVTSLVLPNPWSSPPRYLDAELHALTG